MSALKWLNNFSLLENLLGIYRNYDSQGKTKKCLIIFHILVQSISHLIIVFGQLYLLLIDDTYNQIAYVYCEFAMSSFFTGLLSVVTGIINSRSFTLYLESINRVSNRFQDDTKYINSVKQLYRFATIFVIFAITFAAWRSYDLIVNFITNDYTTYKSICIPVFISQTLLRIIILIEKVMLFVVIMIVVYLCKCLNSLMSSVQERVGRRGITFDEQCDITKEQIQEWLELYQDLVSCCNKITLSFGQQFFFSLLMAVSYYILLTYQMCYLSVLNNQDKKIAVVIVVYVLLTMLPITAGQLVHNQGVKFHRVLARLYITMTMFDSSNAEAKLIKDFIRLIKENPMEFKLLSNLPAGTYLLPVILMSTVNYIIVMLQFSNIV